MEGVRARRNQHHRAPRLYHPERELFVWMCVLAAMVGLLAATATEAAYAGRGGWTMVLAALAGLLFDLYWYVALAFIRNWTLGR